MFYIKSFSEFSKKIDYTIVRRFVKFNKNECINCTKLFIGESMLEFHSNYKINKINSLTIEIDGQFLTYDDIVRHNETFEKIDNQTDYDITAVLVYKNFLKKHII